MEEDELEDDDVETFASVVSKKKSGVSHRVDDLPSGQADCYWCGRVFGMSAMQRTRVHETVIYICKDCS